MFNDPIKCLKCDFYFKFSPYHSSRNTLPGLWAFTLSWSVGVKSYGLCLVAVNMGEGVFSFNISCQPMSKSVAE